MSGRSGEAFGGSNRAVRNRGLRAFVGRLASAAPVPGGGAASAVTGSLGAALLSMVAELSDGNAASAAHRATQISVGSAARTPADHLLELADADAGAFGAFGVALRLPRSTDAETTARTAALRAAARAATEVPLAIIEGCLDVARGAEALAGRSNPDLASDLVVASHFAEAGASGAAANVRVNLPLEKNPTWEAAIERRVARLLSGVTLLAGAARHWIVSETVRPLPEVSWGVAPSAASRLPLETLEAVR